MFVRNVLVGLAMGAGALAYTDKGYGEDVFFIMTHDDLLVNTRLDPIMDPGQISKHVHAIIGGSGFGTTVDYDRSIASECTTANIRVDHSNYWVPQLYNKNANGLTLAPFQFAQTYYQMRRRSDKPNNDVASVPRDAEPVYEFPPGFRMLAGDPNRRTLDESDPAQDAIRYVCLGGDLKETHEFPKGRCSAGVRAQAYFPHCWDGVNSWLEGSKHVAYGEGRYDSGGKCPDTHPKRIMGLFYEFIFDDSAPLSAGSRVWANGDDVGYSFHADFTNGWEEGFFTKIFAHGRECSVGFGLTDCPPLAAEIEKQKCAYKGVTVVEDIGDKSPLAKFPGNNPRAEGYQETAKFSTGSPTNAAVAVIPAPRIKVAPVLGDSPYSDVPDAVSQTGIATSATSQVVSTSAIATSAVTSATGAVSVSASTTTARPASSAQATAIGAATSVPPIAGGALIGQSGSASVSMEASASSSVSVTASASAVDDSSDTTPSEVAPAPASTHGAGRPQKGCGRGGRSRPSRSAY